MEVATQPSAPEQTTSHRTRRHGCSHSGNGLTVAAIVLGFIVAWPVGLAMLAWVIWRKEIKALPFMQKVREARVPATPSLHGLMARKPSNSALAAYLEREQQRLQDEQKKLNELVQAFEAFKQAELAARDRQDFEAFLKQHESQEGQSAEPTAPGGDNR